MLKQLDELSKAVKALDGNLATVNFDPADPVSVRSAIREMEREVDRKVSRWRSNPLVADIAKQTKDSLKMGIEQKARQALRKR